MPLGAGNSDNWLDVSAHMMGQPLSRMTAELARDVALARSRPRSTERSMVRRWSCRQRERGSRAQH